MISEIRNFYLQSIRCRVSEIRGEENRNFVVYNFENNRIDVYELANTRAGAEICC